MSFSPQTGPEDPHSPTDTGLPEAAPAGLRIGPFGPPTGLEVRGEVDRTTLGIWQEALGGLVAGGGDRHLHLAGLTFIDVRGAWLLAQAARDLTCGGRLFLHRSPYCLRSVLALIGPDPSPIEVEAP